MKRILTALILIAAAGAGAAFYFTKAQRGEEREGQTVKVVRADIVSAVSASGVVEPNFQVEVKSKASGEILNFPFEPGDAVSQGRQLLRLDPKTEARSVAQRETELARAMADLESAKATLMERESKLGRARSLHGRGLLSSEDLEAAEAAEVMARAGVEQAEALARKARLDVEDAKERLEETVIYSPIDGVMIEKSVERGQIISSGITSFTGGTKLCVLADLSRMFIMAQVDETDIGRVFEGQEARVTVDAYPDRVFRGGVVRIFPMGEMKDNITVFKVKVEAAEADKTLLKPGMTANVDMIIESRESALIAPDETIRRDEVDGAAYVYVLEDGKPVKRGVKTGVTNGFETEIVEGLEEGDEALLRPPSGT